MPRKAAALTLAAVLVMSACGGEETAAPAKEPSTEVTGSQTPAEKPQKPRPSEKPAGPSLSVEVSGDQISPSGTTLELKTGQRLVIRITSDRAGELHVHSNPEQTIGFGAGRTRRAITIANPGQVDVEEHESGVLVARLLVESG